MRSLPHWKYEVATRTSIVSPGSSQDSPTPTKHAFWHATCLNFLYSRSFFQTKITPSISYWESLYLYLVWKRQVLWHGLGLKETKWKPPITMTASPNHGRLMMAGGKPPCTFFHSDHIISVKTTGPPHLSPWSMSGWFLRRTDLTTPWKLQTILQTAFSEIGNTGLWLWMYKYSNAHVINLSSFVNMGHSNLICLPAF